jgi:AraC-like DNA-binding protein
MGVSIVLISVVVEAAETAGVPRQKLLELAALEPQRLNDQSTRVSLDEYERVQLAALELTGDAALGLHIGERASFAGFDVMPSLVAHSTSLREGLQSYLRFRRILSDQNYAELLESQHTVTLRQEFSPASAASDRFRAELSMAGFLRLIRHFAGAKTAVKGVYFKHVAPAYQHEYTRIFDGTERFEQPFTGIEFDRELLDSAPIHQDSELFEVLEAQASRKLTQLTQGISLRQRVTEHLIAHSTARPDMARVAKQLGMSERSLRRRLATEGAVYAEILDEALTAVAKRLLRDPEQSIAGVAYAMGFSDASAFHRAFKRWTGITPKQFRETP